MKLIIAVLLFHAVKADIFLDIPVLIRDSFEKSASGVCRSQFEGLDTNTIALLFDASGKPSGMANGNFYHLGSYDECYNIKTDNTSGNVGTVYGKYCLTTIPLGIDLGLQSETLRNVNEKTKSNFRNVHINPRVLGQTGQPGFHVGICVPDGCDADELTTLTNGTLVFDEDYCYSQPKAKELTPGAKATISILGIFLGILIISTLLDLYCHYTDTKIPHELLIAFSAFSNGKKLITSTSNPDQLLCLNGLKAISMMWVLLAHEYLNAIAGPLDNFLDVLDFSRSPANMFLLGSSVSVDTFFTIGGLVTVYTFLKATDKGVKFNVILYYVHRYIRLTPSLAILVLIHATLIPFLGSGPTWNVIDGMLALTDCRDYWWSGLLYVQNYWHGSNTCVPQAWYLSVDFQLFLLSPIILIPMKKWPKSTLTFLGFLSIMGTIVPMVLTHYYEISGWFSTGGGGNMEDTMWKSYKQTYARFGPYVIGMIFGYVIYKMKRAKAMLIPFESFFLLLVSLVGLVACLYGPFDIATSSSTSFDFWPNALGNGLLRSAWALGICILVVVCVVGHAGPINWFLSLPIFQFLTKLSYAMYLVHYAVLCIRYASSKIVYRFSHEFMMWKFWGDFALVLVLSLLLCLAFESPMIIIEKHLFGGTGKRAVKKVDAKQKVDPNQNV